MKTTRILLALLLLTFAVWSPTIAEDKPATETKPAAEAKPAAEEEYYYLVYMVGKKIGWAKATQARAKVDGKDMFVEGLHLYMKVKRAHDGMEFETIVESKDYSLTSGQSVRSWQTTKNGGQTSRTEIEYGEKAVTLTQTVDGKSATKTLNHDYTDLYAGHHAWKQLKMKGIKPGASFVFHTVETMSEKILSTTWTIKGETEIKTGEGLVYSALTVEQQTGEQKVTAYYDDGGVPVKMEFGGIIAAERTPKMPEDFKPDVFEGLANMTKSDVALPGGVTQFTASSMEVHFKFKHDDSDIVPYLYDTNGYHDVIKYERDGETGYALKLKAQKLPADYKAPALPFVGLSDEVKAFLKPTPACPSDDKDLLAEAQKQVTGATDSLDAARKLCSFVCGYLGKESGATGNASALQAYKEKKGDCTEHSALFVALARAAGLPARNCSGVVYLTMSDGGGVFGMHAWSEVWLGRWVPVDATVNEVGTSARYMFVNHSEPGTEYGQGRQMRLLEQEVRPVIGYYEMEDGKNWTRKDFKRFDFSKPLVPKGK
ncbi:MAG: transglutaminase domain-containing protein [Planctomycetes bacterium]|nr:transglutaminase domain-containing protein [Planctomycetota bacterium]